MRRSMTHIFRGRNSIQVNTQALSTHRFKYWRYTDDNNCWDFVRAFLIDIAGVPASDLPPNRGISPRDSRQVARTSEATQESLTDCGPEQFAIALHYRGRLNTHVGIVYNGKVWHTGKKAGTRTDTIKQFESMATRTTYKKWQP